MSFEIQSYCTVCHTDRYAICDECESHFMPPNKTGLCFDCRDGVA